ncbi:DUF397 domain-containing protein [Streptomyces olivaceus]|uniref:DUF397 domain-containing protein n=1 Tax=Streptomyces olivaceus TaxID=47716 RepID=UPI00248FC194|nr:DUF397 domain-containing protein [Streptomyces olivaceus]
MTAQTKWLKSSYSGCEGNECVEVRPSRLASERTRLEGSPRGPRLLCPCAFGPLASLSRNADHLRQPGRARPADSSPRLRRQKQVGRASRTGFGWWHRA